MLNGKSLKQEPLWLPLPHECAREVCVARVHVSEFPCYGKSDSFKESVLLKNRYYFIGTHVARVYFESFTVFFALLFVIDANSYSK